MKANITGVFSFKKYMHTTTSVHIKGARETLVHCQMRKDVPVISESRYIQLTPASISLCIISTTRLEALKQKEPRGYITKKYVAKTLEINFM